MRVLVCERACVRVYACVREGMRVCVCSIIMAAVHPSSDSQQAGHAKEDVVKTSVVTHKSGPP